MHASVTFLIAALSAGALAVPLSFTNTTTTPVNNNYRSTTTPYVSSTTQYYNDKPETKYETITKTETKTLTDAYYVGGKTSYSTYLTKYVYTTRYAVPYQTYAPVPTPNYQANDYYQANGCPAAYTSTVTVKEAPSGAVGYYYPPGKKCDKCQEVKYYDVSLGIDVTIYVPYQKETYYQAQPTPYQKETSYYQAQPTPYKYTTSSSTSAFIVGATPDVSLSLIRPTSTSAFVVGATPDVGLPVVPGSPSSSTSVFVPVPTPDAKLPYVPSSSSSGPVFAVPTPDAGLPYVPEPSSPSTFVPVTTPAATPRV